MFIHAHIIGTPTGKTQGIPIVEAGRLAYMNTLSDRIIQALTETQKNQSELARHVGVRSPSVNDWVSGKTKTIKGQNLLRAAEFLNVNPKWLAEGTGPKSAASLKTVMDALEQIEEDQKPDRESNLTQKLPFDDGYTPSSPLMSEIQSRDVPPHIEQAIMALLQTCKQKPETATPADPRMGAALKAFDRLLDSLPEDQLYLFVGFREHYLSGGGRGFVSPDVYESGSADPIQADGDQPKKSEAR